ncbi:beta-1,3-galactosyl-o-glycosyl-glycoprotein beta-1,6-n-acetylglucosaminyltransferase-like [Plakobranchus ocellatus]|uniref:Beta-1,3-galactosyl-o-glycosyl-glycoprotein beta-1,6-n-acetylglucosaminyltransferase-like n=1 Tax=Plakobranchus ocellatus TaxID=259542 RepID=A0AAV3ZBV6_9GAST|nr:beta-1,3-galactosyl-o-glycosyl-glycoprotein beta-1,6-n-acetylglucosaminyltransferase-like [Plakobranchus ocellatus]
MFCLHQSLEKFSSIQVVFLLRAIYRPINVYCLTVDTNAGETFLQAALDVAKCLPNVFVASRLERIVYAGFSRLQADINCMGDLLQHPVRWRYVINMPGQQFPLRTNLELVRIIKTLNGTNDVEGSTDAIVEERFALYILKIVMFLFAGEDKVFGSGMRNPDPPHGIQIVKGSAYSTLSREFVQFALSDKVARDFLEWLKDVYSPDEYFWATLQYAKNMNVPGGFKGPAEKKPWLTSFAKWSCMTHCKTKEVRGVCILSPEDLPDLLHQPALTVNKFYIDHHPAALHCLDEFLYNLTVFNITRDFSFYEHLGRFNS